MYVCVVLQLFHLLWRFSITKLYKWSMYIIVYSSLINEFLTMVFSMNYAYCRPMQYSHADYSNLSLTNESNG